MQPEYIGDGVYISPGSYPGELVMTTGNHEIAKAENVIYMEPEVVAHLVEYLRKNGVLQ